jgi:tetratricopeptide (TPR) repeat protein
MEEPMSAISIPRVLAPVLLAVPLIAAAQFKPILGSAPAPWKAYLDAARQADTIADPLARCLAFPDLPGNAWPAGLAKSYCETLHAKVMSLAEIAALLDQGQVAQLEQAMRAELTGHFTAHAETLHRLFAGFSSDAQADRVSALWLAQRPASAFALSARAQHLANKAWDALLGDDAAGARKLAAEARTLLERALESERKMLPAHALLIELGIITGERKLADAAWKRGAAVDPGCRELARQRMRALRPRWGGTLAEMQAFARELAPRVASRPLLANVMAMATVEQADSLLGMAQHDKALALLKPAAMAAPYPDLAWRLVHAMGELPSTDRFEYIATLVGAGRFADDEYVVAYERGRQLMQAGDGDWAVRALEHALTLKPDRLAARQALGAAYVQAGKPAEAEPHFVAALESPELRPLTLRALVASMKGSAHQDRTARYAELLTREQPESAHGWSVLGHARYRLKDYAGARSAFERFLTLAEARDPAWAGARKEIDQLLAVIRQGGPA